MDITCYASVGKRCIEPKYGDETRKAHKKICSHAYAHKVLLLKDKEGSNSTNTLVTRDMLQPLKIKV